MRIFCAAASRAHKFALRGGGDCNFVGFKPIDSPCLAGVDLQHWRGCGPRGGPWAVGLAMLSDMRRLDEVVVKERRMTCDVAKDVAGARKERGAVVLMVLAL